MIGDILQPTHLIFIFVVALLVLGPKRLPEVGRSLGKGIRDFKGAMAGIEDHARDVFDPSDEAATPSEPTEAAPETLTAPEPVEAETVALPAVTASSPAANSAVQVATATSVTGSGSGFAEPHPDDYAD